MKTRFISCILLFSFICSMSVFGQASFSFLLNTPADERIFDGTENAQGNFIFVGRKLTSNPFSESAYLLALNSEGQLIHEMEFNNQDTASYFGIVYSRNDSIIIFGAKGLALGDHMFNELWVLILDENFNTIKNETFNLGNYKIIDLESIINSHGNYLICGSARASDGEPDIFFYEISSTGDSVKSNIVSLYSGQYEQEVIEKNDDGYKVFAFGLFPGAPPTNGTIAEFDSMFNYISADSIPNSLLGNFAARWLTDSTYLLTGKKPVYNPYKNAMGIIKLDLSDQLIQENHYGKSGDTSHHVGACSNLEVMNKGSIYFGGTSNIIEKHLIYQPEHSWLILNNIDSNLNLNWQKFYGGDAFYYLWGLKGTSDGGCLLLATRYDTAVQDQEMDIYIIKVDSNGLLTSTGEGPAIPVQQLAIYPNPAKDNISIRYPDIFGNDQKEIILYNLLGTEVKREDATLFGTQINMDVSILPPGLYFTVLYVDGQKVATGKVLVVR